jgi:hypothetical protein
MSSSVLCAGLNSAGWNLVEIPDGQYEAPRTYTVEVVFPEAFNVVPVVHAAVSGFDIDQRDSARISTAVSLITTQGFSLAITTWRGTRVYGVEVSWLAVGH